MLLYILECIKTLTKKKLDLPSSTLSNLMTFSMLFSSCKSMHPSIPPTLSNKIPWFTPSVPFILTTDLMVAKTAETIKKYGVSHSRSQLVLKIFDLCMEKKPDLRCHCSNKNPHYCALSQAFKSIKFETEDDLFKADNLLILKLLFCGATYRNLTNSK